MGRHKQPEIRERLLAELTDHVLADGVPDRLQPLAVACGTSPRMLLYHFGTRQELLRAVLRNARRRHREEWGALFAARPGEAYPTTLARAWAGITGTSGRRYVDVFTRLREDQEQQLWPDFRREATTDWFVPLEEGLRSIGRPELATLVLAVVRGLLMDLHATGDQQRVDAAFADFLATLA